MTVNPGSIDKVTLDGSVTAYPIPTSSPFPEGITSGPDGNLWFTACYTQGIWRVTPSGVFTEFTLPIGVNCSSGDIISWQHFLWIPVFESPSGLPAIARVSTSGTLKLFPLSPPTFAIPWGIAIGPDHNIWFTDQTTYVIARMTSKGIITTFGPTTYPPREIAAGPDGSIWFVEASGYGDDTPPTIGKITTSGAITEYTLAGNALPLAIARGVGSTMVVTDYRGILWFVNTAGTYSYTGKNMPPIFGGAPVGGVTLGDDGNYWFTSGGYAGIYVRLLMSASPSNISFTGVGQNQPVVISEKSYGGSWTASTGDSNVATVAQGQNANTFVVTSVGSGSTNVSISDTKSNTLLVPVTVP